MQTDNDNNNSHSQEWLITYSDLMSLFLCFFIMLYAISTVQETKFQSATESLRGGFGLFGTTNSPHHKLPNLGSASKASGQKIGGTILFDLGSDDLSEETKQQLNDIYHQLLSTSQNIQIIGQAELGEPSGYRRELDLAYSRAVNVWDHLISLGINRERCQIVQQTGESKGALVEIQYMR
jgi:flagellar motor protein MotB